MTEDKLVVTRRALRQETIKHLVADPAFRLLQGLTADQLHTIVELVIRARQKAIAEIKAKQEDGLKQLEAKPGFRRETIPPDYKYKKL